MIESLIFLFVLQEKFTSFFLNLFNCLNKGRLKCAITGLTCGDGIVRFQYCTIVKVFGDRIIFWSLIKINEKIMKLVCLLLFLEFFLKNKL
jgi:hypothetical protein